MELSLKKILQDVLMLVLVFIGLGISTIAFLQAEHGLVIDWSQNGEELGAAALFVVPPPSPPVTLAFAPPIWSGSLPERVQASVPFISQAPRGDWSAPWDEACEEASVLMVMAWLNNKKNITVSEGEKEIHDIVNFENYHFGFYEDTALAETEKIFMRHYEYPNTVLTRDATANDIKRTLALGGVVIVPLAGELYSNPYYRKAPPYHMVVVTGYDDLTNVFIANDPGTRAGRSFRYDQDELIGAMHDWTGSDLTMRDGRAGILSIFPHENRL